MDASAGEPIGDDRASREPRQRMRFVFRRAAEGTRDAAGTSDGTPDPGVTLGSSLEASGLPLAAGRAGRRRSALTLAAPLPVSMAAEHELADLFLAERCAIYDVRQRLEAALPETYELLDLYDVWLGEPPLPAQAAAADYRIVLEDDPPPDRDRLADAASRVLGATSIRRERRKGRGTAPYDLRPLIIDVAVAPHGPPTEIRARTRFHPELGTGRPEEVLAALSDEAALTLTPQSIVRERVLLHEELEA